MRTVLRPLRRGAVEVYWALRAPAIANPPLPRGPRSFLFLCKGNICRSPFAEHFAAALLPGAPRDAFRSAGLEVGRPQPSPAEAVEAAAGHGVDLRGHLSAAVSTELVSSSDMVVAMEASHFFELRERYPDHRARIFLLPLFERDRARLPPSLRCRIPDPYGRPVGEFRSCYARIESGLRECLVALRAGRELR